MIRYCKNCKKQYDFKIKDMNELDHLICPVCGQRVDKNSRTGNDPAEGEAPAMLVGKLYYLYVRFFFLFFPLCGAVGVACYFLEMTLWLYVTSAFATILFLLRYGSGHRYLIWPILGALCGGLYFRTTEGICLGLCLCFIVRFLCQQVLFKLVAKLIRMGQ